jgi:hypothetical protein
MAAVSVRSFPERRTLTTTDRIVVRAIAEAMFAQDGEVDPARLDAHVGEVDAFVSAASKMIRVGLRIALVVVRLAPLLFFFRARPIERLTIDERVAILGRLERSGVANLSLAFIGWRTVMTLVFYEHPIELARLGYTTDERTRYKRHLPTLAGQAPAPASSGVRLVDETSEPASGGSREVA